MTIEIEENTLNNLKENEQIYIDLISRYDNSIKIKNELIKGLENEINISKEIIIELLDIISKQNINEQSQLIISDILKTLSNFCI